MKKTALFFALGILPALTLAQTKNPDDPYESYNRFMYGVNDNVDRFAMKPVAKGYRTVTPKPLRQNVGNFFNNFRDVYSVASNILRADFKKAANDTMRVAINTTWGIGGLFDIASEAQMPNNKNTLGDTFASWGWKNSNYFVYPLLGPSTVRDASATTITLAAPGSANIVFHGKYDPVGAMAANGVNVRAQALSLTDSLEEAALDPYTYTRDAYMGYRKQSIYGAIDAPEGDGIDDLVAPDETNHSEINPSVEQEPSVNTESDNNDE